MPANMRFTIYDLRAGWRAEVEGVWVGSFISKFAGQQHLGGKKLFCSVVSLVLLRFCYRCDH
jgi:hypothetical protein